MIKKISVVLFISLFLGVTDVLAQASLVPVYHQVYDWMHYQRVRGNAPFYNYEALPLTRGQITTIISEIDESRLNRGDLHVRESYLREFSVDSLKKYETNSFIQGKGKFYNRWKKILFSDEEPHTYVWDDANATLAFDWFPGRGLVFVEDGDRNYSSPYYAIDGFRSYGTFSGVVGYNYDFWRAVQVGDNEAFRYLPFLSRNWKTLNGGSNKYHLNTSAGYHKGYWSIHIGRGMLKYGVGQRNNLVYSRESIPFDWVRLNIDSKYIKYSVIHGYLSWSSGQRREIEGFDDLFTRTSPNRFTVHHRLQFQPAKWISLSYYELIDYSNRKVELAYINPVNRLAFMEWELQDQDNGFAGFEGVLRPINGLELFGEILIDDLGSSKDIFKWDNKKASNSTFARYLGVNYALKTGTVFTSSYQRVDPSVYAHKFQLNTHAEKGIGLGSQIGPNGDELSFQIEQWLSHRTRILIRYDFDRHGLNYFDENGEFVDVGGDINDSYYIDPDTKEIIRATEYLVGDIHRWNRFTVEATYEPWRGIRLKGEYSLRNMLEGEQLNDLSIFNFTLQVGY